MTDASEKPAFLIVCGTATGKPMDPEYGKRATLIALQTGLRPIGGGEVGSPQFELLEGSLPEGSFRKFTISIASTCSRDPEENFRVGPKLDVALRL